MGSKQKVKKSCGRSCKVGGKGWQVGKVFNNQIVKKLNYPTLK